MRHFRFSLLSCTFAAGVAVLGAATALCAAAPRVLEPGQLPADSRLGPLKDLNGSFPWTPSSSKAAWEKRAEALRRQVLVSQGLWPMPTKTPMNAVIHGKIDRGDYTVEKVYFESFPGFFVTGNLYRPKGKTGKLPGVLSPHGHWADGRFHDNERGIKQELVSGAERFAESGRSHLQARQVQLARMGCVAFHYDMVGYADSQQIPFKVAHHEDAPPPRRPEMEGLAAWGFFSAQAESHALNVMGLQTWNSIRALDFLLSLPDVDATRIAVSGESGGGTQTFLLTAVDPRPALAFPAVMVSTGMQGGCSCENASLLRVGSGNVELAALFAPKPLGLTSAHDWTREMTTKGFPELQRHYRMLGAPENVMLKAAVHFKHNYNYVSRAAFYSWLNKHFRLGLSEPVVEEDYLRLTKAEMSVWDAQHPAPAGGVEVERTLLGHWHADAQRHIAEASKSPAELRRMVAGAVDVLIGRNLEEAGEVGVLPKGESEAAGYVQSRALLQNKTYREELPIIVFSPRAPNGHTVVWLTGNGKSGLWLAEGSLRPAVAKLVAAGATVVGIDLLFQGEFTADGAAVASSRRVKDPANVPALTFGYNRALFAQRVHDILTAIQFARQQSGGAKAVHFVGDLGAGPWVAAARAQAGDAIASAALDTDGFRFAKILDVHDVNFLPGGAKYFDLTGMLALHAPGRLWLTGEANPAIVEQAYAAGGMRKNLVLAGKTDADAMVAWIAAGF
ncbi:MAG: acetylxylan esterase [Opitutus sp.]|nr:acetylxylan esterase [Opitutus sp.]